MGFWLDEFKPKPFDSLQRKALQSSISYYWRVRIKRENGNVSAWSKPSRWITGLVDTELKADWIGFDKPSSTTPHGTDWFNIDKADWIVHPNFKKGVNAVTNYRSNFTIPVNSSRVMAGMEANYTARCLINGIFGTKLRTSNLKVVNLKTEYKINPVVEVEHPRLSWQFGAQ